MSQESKATLYPVLTAEVLLVHPRRKLILEKLKKNCGLEARYYQICYEPLINYFAEMVQALPFQPGGGPGTLMDYGLERAELMLQVYRQEVGENFDPRYAYACVVAALLQDIGKIVGNQKVIIADSLGNFIAYWTPFEGALVGKADFYKLRFFEAQWVTLAQEATPLLVRQIIPFIGLIWLSQDNRILQMLLAALADDSAAGEKVHLWLQLTNKRLQNLPPKDRLPPLRINATSPPETEIGEAFLRWLNHGLQDGSILVDRPDACVHRLPDGGIFLECPRIFRYFCDGYIERIDWLIPCQQFIALGLTTTPAGTFNFVQYYFKVTRKAAAPTSQSGQIFLGQNKPRPVATDASKSKANQSMIREGLVIPPENTSMFYGKFATLTTAPAGLQPVAPALNASTVASKSLESLLEQNWGNKQLEQGRH